MKNTMLKAALAAMLAIILCAAAAVAEPQIVDDPLGAASQFLEENGYENGDNSYFSEYIPSSIQVRSLEPT